MTWACGQAWAPSETCSSAWEAFSPLCWRGVHLALLDLVRQVGLPQLFFTLAPYEWSFPYHDWVLDAMAKQLRPRLCLPVAETLHIAHVLTQAVKGLLLGRTGGQLPWASHVFACPGEAKLQFFLRLEYQDGTRKAASQDYHGSGRVHVHVIAFAPPGVLAKLPIADQVQAVLPDEPNLRGYVEGSQLDREGRSGHPVDAEPTRFDEAKGQRRLHHSEAAESGLRAYVADLMEVLKCHQDFQFCGDDASLLRAYVAKYVSKFSDAASDEWLNDDASDRAHALQAPRARDGAADAWGPLPAVATSWSPAPTAPLCRGRWGSIWRRTGPEGV